MITDRQFEDAFTAAGGWFILTQFATVYEWTGEKKELVDELYLKGFDSKRSGTSTRVSSLLRLINNNRGKEALDKARNSERINKIHPEAYSLGTALIERYYSNSVR